MSSALPSNEPALTRPPSERPELPDGVAPTPVRPAWQPLGVLLAFGLGLALTLAGGVLVGGVAAAFGADVHDLPSGVNVLLTVVQDAAFVGAAVFVASKVAKPAAWQFGLRGTRMWPAVGWAAVAFVAFAALSQVYSLLVDIGPQEKLPDQLGADGSTLALVLAAALVTVVAPIAEELFFRGFVFGTLRGWRGTGVAAVLTGALFGAIHAGSAPSAKYLPILAIFGWVLCLLYARTGSLYPCICLHAINNCIAFGGTQHGWGWQYVALLAGSLGVIAVLATVVDHRAAPAPALA